MCCNVSEECTPSTFRVTNLDQMGAELVAKNTINAHTNTCTTPIKGHSWNFKRPFAWYKPYPLFPIHSSDWPNFAQPSYITATPPPQLLQDPPISDYLFNGAYLPNYMASHPT